MSLESAASEQTANDPEHALAFWWWFILLSLPGWYMRTVWFGTRPPSERHGGDDDENDPA